MSITLGNRLKAFNISGRDASGGVTSASDVDFFNSIVNQLGSCMTFYPYSWTTNCRVSCYNGNTEIVSFDTNGQAIILVSGRCRPNSWDCLTYIVIGGMNHNASDVLRLITGTMSYNGGSTLNRHCRTF